MQNKTHAVMSQRWEGKESLDNFPTPPWATRALIEHVMGSAHALSNMSCLEPACGAGHMAKVLHEYFGQVVASDIHPYGYGDLVDFIRAPYEVRSFDWVITNPPFRLAEEFILKSLNLARCGVAILTRTVFLESVGRYDRLFKASPPTKFAQFAERVPMVKGRLDKSASTATGYCWLLWEKQRRSAPKLVWIPACRRVLEREGDYDVPNATSHKAARLIKTPKLKVLQPKKVSQKHTDLFSFDGN